MKVKVINSITEPEEKVNDFIKDKKIIDIKFNVSGPWHYILVMYEEYEKTDLFNCLKEFQNHSFYKYREYQNHTISEKEFIEDSKKKFEEIYKKVNYLLEKE